MASQDLKRRSLTGRSATTDARGEHAARNPSAIREGSAAANTAPDVSEKAFRVNLDETKYGTIAEIGAGQEVARQFFRAGGAAGTVAKSMSAYDMVVSDTIYGECKRYVSRERLIAMLDHEYERLVRRLDEPRGEETSFFAFADTVAARSHSYQQESHGWMGVRFQTEPRGRPNQIELHVRMRDEENLAQQEALGIVGVNLIHGAFVHADQPERLLRALADGLSEERVEINVVHFRGPAFEDVDHRIVSLQLVEHGLSRAVMLAPDREILQPAEALYKKAVLVERGVFHPLQPVHVAIHEHAAQHFRWYLDTEEGKDDATEQHVEIVKEMTLHHLAGKRPGDDHDPVEDEEEKAEEEAIDHETFLARADAVASTGSPVLVTSYLEHYRVAEYLDQLASGPVAFVAGTPTLRKLFDKQYYANLSGGRLEGMGRLFQSAEKLYVFPRLDDETGALKEERSTDEIVPHAEHLHAYLVEEGYLEYLEAPSEEEASLEAVDEQ